MTDDPCDDWPVFAVGGRLVLYATFEVYAVARIAGSLRSFGERIREANCRCIKIASRFDDEAASLARLPDVKNYFDSEQNRARGYRKFEYGGARWGKAHRR